MYLDTSYKKSYAETPDIYDPKNAAGEARKAVKELIKRRFRCLGVRKGKVSSS